MDHLQSLNFQLKRYKWATEDGPAITTLFWEKCVARTKDNLSKECRKALQNAGADHPGSGVLYMHEYSPWWCSADVWNQMCEKWREHDWIEKRSIASNNRFAGAPSADKAKGIYRVAIFPSYIILLIRRLSLRALLSNDFDQELWERASVVRKNYIKGQGQKRHPSFIGSFNGSRSTQSSQSSTHPSTHTPADCVRAICADPELLRILGGHLGALDPDVLARAVAEAATSQRADDSQSLKNVFLVVYRQFAKDFQPFRIRALKISNKTLFEEHLRDTPSDGSLLPQTGDGYKDKTLDQVLVDSAGHSFHVVQAASLAQKLYRKELDNFITVQGEHNDCQEKITMEEKQAFLHLKRARDIQKEFEKFVEKVKLERD
ncbi:hypothetical protein POM88_000045 [Heracleum sosnowskyi]|uniref:Uncharacterized protein n=1 Tax=Heracleum sosnowskyi TaxID=360622 RepID=A0AAD8N3M1_9APIA|nr:hypothetical protein POM88_000045 [Heracleum sosnowskyi]